MAEAQPYWELAEQRLRQEFGELMGSSLLQYRRQTAHHAAEPTSADTRTSNPSILRAKASPAAFAEPNAGKRRPILHLDVRVRWCIPQGFSRSYCSYAPMSMFEPCTLGFPAKSRVPTTAEPRLMPALTAGEVDWTCKSGVVVFKRIGELGVSVLAGTGLVHRDSGIGLPIPDEHGPGGTGWREVKVVVHIGGVGGRMW